jgi:gamma-glutamylcyclotransferase (GGCT)/AIG2-like uncharacterized protein YtfP
MPFLFVYGTLMRRQWGTLHPLLAGQAGFTDTGYFQGRLYQVARWYPGVVILMNAGDRVFGETYKIKNPAALFGKLDRYEGCSPDFAIPRDYKRQLHRIFLSNASAVLAWLYLYNRPVNRFRRLG